MVTLQILVLPFLVRVRVPQQQKTSDEEVFFLFPCEIYGSDGRKETGEVITK